MKEDFFTKVENISERDRRYKPEAYVFVMKALSYTQKNFKKDGHVTGKDLLHGIREYCFEQFGTMSKNVLEHWGINKNDDFGQIVFNMVNEHLLKKTEQDSIEDFRGVFDFNEAFGEGYRRRFEQDLKKTLGKKE